jgi:hypothetical protein
MLKGKSGFWVIPKCLLIHEQPDDACSMRMMFFRANSGLMFVIEFYDIFL